MMKRPGQGAVGSILVITSLIEPETVVKAPICMQGSSQQLRNILSYEQKKGVDNKRDESRQNREQHPVEVFAKRKSGCRVIKHTNTDTHWHSVSKQKKKSSLHNPLKFNHHRQDRTFKCEMTNAGIGANKWLGQKISILFTDISRGICLTSR